VEDAYVYIRGSVVKAALSVVISARYYYYYTTRSAAFVVAITIRFMYRAIKSKIFLVRRILPVTDAEEKR